MKGFTLTRLPIFGCAGFIAFLFLANIWNFAVERDWPKLRIRSASPLAGVAKPRPAPWTLEAFLSGETQKAVSNNIGRALPVFPISVRAKNQLVYSLFGNSGASGVVVGRGGQLFEQNYIEEFCKRGSAPDVERIAQWAASLREIQDDVEAAGKSFIFVISPSKAARYADDLPASASCASRVATIPDKLAPYVAALRENGVRFVDGAGLISARRPDYEIALFPRGGTHWNLLGAALALHEATRVSPSAIGRFDFTWRLAPQPGEVDRDLIDLLNLLWPDLSYPTAIVNSDGAAGDCAKTPRLLAVGGSFLHEILIAATHAPCPPRIDYWFYMRTESNGVELGHFTREPREIENGARESTEPAALAANMRAADLVILEENKSGVGTTKQLGQALSAARESVAR